MLRRPWVAMLACAGVVGGWWLAAAVCQQRPAGESTPGGPADASAGRSRIQDFRQRMEDQMRQQLGATEEEWKQVLQPRIEKVQQLQRQSRGGFRGMFGPGGPAGRGRRGGPQPPDAAPEGAPAREASDVEKKTEALRLLLDDKTSGAAAISAALEALRQAKAKAEQELAAARKELRSVVTVRQEAALVLMGLLD